MLITITALMWALIGVGLLRRAPRRQFPYS